MFRRKLGPSNIMVSAMGLGCWAIGGNTWGDVDDNDSIRAIQRALDLGITLFDTADVYGSGHSEQILGQALGKRRSEVFIATKFGNGKDKQIGNRSAGAFITRACEASLKRLNTDYIDLYQFHKNNYGQKAEPIRDALEALVAAGKIRYYGWSTDLPEEAQAFLGGKHYVAVQQRLNLFEGDDATLALCEQHGLASINRGPLAMGLLTGKFTSGSKLPKNDIRGRKIGWIKSFANGKPNADWLAKLDAIRHILTSEGRSLTQGALAWLWGCSENTIPIPGFKTVDQVEENIGAMSYGPLRQDQMQEIEKLLA